MSATLVHETKENACLKQCKPVELCEAEKRIAKLEEENADLRGIVERASYGTMAMASDARSVLEKWGKK